MYVLGSKIKIIPCAKARTRFGSEKMTESGILRPECPKRTLIKLPSPKIRVMVVGRRYRTRSARTKMPNFISQKLLLKLLYMGAVWIFSEWRIQKSSPILYWQQNVAFYGLVLISVWSARFSWLCTNRRPLDFRPLSLLTRSSVHPRHNHMANILTVAQCTDSSLCEWRGFMNYL